ncbi:MAG: large subunit ribosomal protein L1 [Parcubacteria group bacterium Gr01-1014_18]|nr:MAG: large subunit ribosomal protein L1 [Parcubacteria group bacterium Greene0416_36]TSC79847.1 MAG: large subunit ribosomal protein L1 [Parcubacteria group bacterium Gr01-1014_18]TSC98279.1 MAG: large subunit ribosomal protein L1 [Parcubacteria group bacterium Greene1014_20]TSD06681.1 MAG: large subunit ribosomal protein L1 [Parcubacteria group bacterium Greene0714_2]
MSTYMGKKYLEAKKLIDENKAYSPEEAMDLVIKTSKTKFDGSVELHFRLGIDPTKGEQLVRGNVELPHGTGKSVKIAVFTIEKTQEAKDAGADLIGGSELIEEIKKSGKCDFDVAIADPGMMKLLAPLARILGPKGLMPSPKNETVTANIAGAVKALKKGKVSFKNDNTSNVHMMIGRVSFGKVKLVENFTVAANAIRKAKPSSSKGSYIRSVTLHAAMGPGIKVGM